MGFIAIVGCGALGGAIAHKLAGRDRVGEVRLIDPEGTIAKGKALDILQSSPIEQFSTRITSADGWAAAAGADVIVVADDGATSNEHAGEAGLSMLRRLVKFDGAAPIVFAGTAQRELMARAAVELKVPRHHLLGSAPLALESAVRALAGVLLDTSGVEVALRIVGVPPHAAVVAWEEASASALPLSSQLRAHEIAALTSKIRSLWPPGPYALASAASRVVEGLVGRSRRRFSCFVALARGPLREARDFRSDVSRDFRSELNIVAMPVELGREGVRRVLQPSLTRQEQTLLENAIEM
jgi:malate dehydrogenase